MNSNTMLRFSLIAIVAFMATACAGNPGRGYPPGGYGYQHGGPEYQGPQRRGPGDIAADAGESFSAAADRLCDNEGYKEVEFRGQATERNGRGEGYRAEARVRGSCTSYQGDQLPPRGLRRVERQQ